MCHGTAWLAPVRAAAFVIAVGTSAAGAHSLAELEEMLLERERYVEITDRPAPGFALVDPVGRAVSLDDYRGKVVVLWFTDADCQDICPILTAILADVQAEVNRTPMRERVQFIAVDTDPEHNPPERVAGYAELHYLDPANFVLLSSQDEPEATRRLAAEYGLIFEEVGDGEYMHAAVTNLIDSAGTLRARYHGVRFEPVNLIIHINALSNDLH